jgi:chaperonin cofactor prefoldin
VKDVLGKLGTASILLWKIKSFKQYLNQLHENLLKTNVTSRIQTLQHQMILLQKTYETLSERIQKILRDHVGKESKSF